jgi:hypothetical protein
MNKEEFLKAIMELSKVETINPISTMNSINVDDLMSAIDRLNKVPTYDELLKENKKQKEVIDKVIEIIEPLTEFDMCTINGKILRKPLDILKEVSE